MFSRPVSKPVSKASYASPREAERHRELLMARLREKGYAIEEVDFVGIRILRNARGSIQSVIDDTRTAEIARMLGGSDLTSVATRHAQEMLEAAGQP